MDACIATHREISAGSAEIFMPLKIQAENVGKLEKSENYEFFMMNIVEPRLSFSITYTNAYDHAPRGQRPVYCLLIFTLFRAASEDDKLVAVQSRYWMLAENRGFLLLATSASASSPGIRSPIAFESR
ncbi:hypothetical protein V9T40_006969 [Parthenolecanium corni]|uniref:Uncharacterized protein n=1 Tax=Parthenolecanium corni TaxID=536013 RepID=A0AAN9TVJ1_9HEMI